MKTCATRIKGTVKTWLDHIGVGYVAPADNYALDIFVGRTHVPDRDGRRVLTPGEPVEFELRHAQYALKAVNLSFPSAT
jgi:cold shock CspA family protein